MIRVVINHDIVVGPVPIIDIVIVVRRNTEIKTAEPETLPISALHPVDMIAANFAAEASVFPGMIEVIVGIIAPRVMSNLAIVLSMDVRRLGVT